MNPSTQLHIRKLGVVWLVALYAFTLTLAAGPASAQTYPASATKALAWVKTQQQPDGSFAGFGAGSTVDATLAIVAAGQDPSAYAQGGNTPITFLQSHAADLAKTPGGAGKLLIAVSALGLNPNSFGGVDLLDTLNKSYDPKTGHYGQDIIGHAFAMLGLKAAGQPVPAQAVAFLASAQGPDGGWSFSGDTKPGAADTNSTAVAIQALVATGGAGPNTIKMGVVYLTSQQNSDGGFPYQKGGENGGDSDVNSTAYVVQASQALGNLTQAEQGLKFILSLQKPDGAFGWMLSAPDDNAGATYQAIPALLGATLLDPKATNAVQTLPTPIPTGTGSVTPGMPRTGAPSALVPALALFAALLLAMGIVARQKRA